MRENEVREFVEADAKKNALKRMRTALYMECVDCEAAAVPVTNHRLEKIRIGVSRLFKGSGSKDREQGFTLVELLVVLAILGLLIALVAPAMIRQLGSAKHKIAEQSVERLAGILDLYRLDVGDYPSTAQGLAALNENAANVAGWNGPYLKDAAGINDPWGHAFQYRYPSQRPNHSFDIVSLGADGKPGGSGESSDIINR